MELKFKRNEIEITNKVTNKLDREVAEFVKLLHKYDYVIISGYIAILFGRSRGTEDVDIFVDFKNKKEFLEFCNELKKKNYYIINALDDIEAYELLNENVPIRIAKEGEIMPNFEIKLPSKETDKISLSDKKVVKFGKYHINTSPIELQIAYKLFLGSEKDYLDAAHLYSVLGEYLDKGKFYSFIKMLGIKDNIVKEVLGVDKNKQDK